MAKHKAMVIVSPEDTNMAEEIQVEETIEVAKADTKALSNVALIVAELKRSITFDNVLKNVLNAKPEYKSKEKGDKVMLKQITNIYEMIKTKEPRFAKKWKLDTKTGLVVDVDEIDKEIVKHSKKKSAE